MLLAPIHYRDKAVRTEAGWKISERDLVVQRWWVTDGYFPTPTDSSFARPTRQHAA